MPNLPWAGEGPGDASSAAPLGAPELRGLPPGAEPPEGERAGDPRPLRGAGRRGERVEPSPEVLQANKEVWNNSSPIEKGARQRKPCACVCVFPRG